MAQRISKWQADDGSIHETEEAASRHEHKALVASIIEDLTCHGTVDPSELLEALINGDLGKEVLNYHTAWDA